MPVRRRNMSNFIVREQPPQAEIDLVRFVRSSASERVLVFCRKREETERVAELFERDAVRAAPYHSTIPDRAQALASFVSGVNTRTHDVSSSRAHNPP
jgi:superfamily II DNA/RNA helicase